MNMPPSGSIPDGAKVTAEFTWEELRTAYIALHLIAKDDKESPYLALAEKVRGLMAGVERIREARGGS